MSGIRKKASVLLLLNILGVGIWPVALKVVGGSQSTYCLLFLSFLLASIVSLVLMVGLGEVDGFKSIFSSRKNAAVTAIGGLLVYALPSILLSVGAAHVSASLSSVIFRSWVLFTIPFLPLFLKTRINKYQVVAVSIGFLAVFVAITQGSLLTIDFQSLPFVALVLLSAVSVAIGNLIIKTRNSTPMAQMLFFDICAAVAFGFVSLAAGQASAGYLLAQMTASNLLVIAFLGIVSYSIGSYFYLYALKVFDPVLVGNASMLAPFITFLFASMFVQETLYAYYAVLAFIVLFGIAIQQLAHSKAYERVARRASSPVIFDITGAFVENKHPHLLTFMRGDGRALATIVKTDVYSAIGKNDHGCLIFTNKNPPESVKKEELAFIEGIMLPGQDEMILMALGDVDSAEQVLLNT